MPLLAGLSATRFHRLTATLPLLPKSAPPFELPPVRLICRSTDLGGKRCGFGFALHFLPVLRRELEPINHRERIIPLPFPSAPVKIIRHKPLHGILTTRKHKTGPLPAFTTAPIPSFSSVARPPPHTISQVEPSQDLIQSHQQRFKSSESDQR